MGTARAYRDPGSPHAFPGRCQGEAPWRFSGPAPCRWGSRLAKNDIYTADDLANNWILTCQGHCFGPEVEITYDVV